MHVDYKTVPSWQNRTGSIQTYFLLLCHGFLKLCNLPILCVLLMILILCYHSDGPFTNTVLL